MTTVANELQARAGVLVERHAMVWTRYLDAPLAEVWSAVSTREGLARWWLVPPKAFELREGGVFDHHWRNTIRGFRTGEHIDFSQNTGAYASTGGMRFELAAAADGSTVFKFLDTWGPAMSPPRSGEAAAEQPGGPGTPWAGVAAGWHRMLDGLEGLFDPDAPTHSYDALIAFYAPYLRDLYRLRDMVQRREA